MRFPSISFVLLSIALSTALGVQGAPQREAQLETRATDVEASLQRRDVVSDILGLIQTIQNILTSLLSSAPLPSAKSTQMLKELLSEVANSAAAVGSAGFPAPSLPIPIPSQSFPAPSLPIPISFPFPSSPSTTTTYTTSTTSVVASGMRRQFPALPTSPLASLPVGPTGSTSAASGTTSASSTTTVATSDAQGTTTLSASGGSTTSTVP